VIYSWAPIADALVKAGLATREAAHYTLDLKALIQAVLASRTWSDLGFADLSGRARLISSDPNKSSSGFMFAGLAADILAGGVTNATSLPAVLPSLVELFRIMGFTPGSSDQVFDAYIAGGPGADALVIAYENQLIEWIIADPARWQRVQQASAPKPVLMYPHPTVDSAHPMIALSEAALPLIDALMSPELQAIGWQNHGFRGTTGAIGAGANPLVAGRMPAQIAAVAPMPTIDVMLAILDALSSPEGTPTNATNAATNAA
jgi:ABC-type Fe3+ transport system substrate-binding protein